MLLLRRLAYRLMAQLTFLGKVQTVNLNVSYEDVSVSTHFTRNFRPLYFGLHRIFDLMAKRHLFGFQLAQMHFGLVLMPKSRNPRAKTLVDKSAGVKSK